MRIDFSNDGFAPGLVLFFRTRNDTADEVLSVLSYMYMYMYVYYTCAYDLECVSCARAWFGVRYL